MAELTRDAVLEQVRERILAFATSRGSRDHAEDLAQEVLLVLHEKYSHVTEFTELVPLSFQILRYKMLDCHRKLLRRGEYNSESVDDHPLADPQEDPASKAEQRERVTNLITALLQVGERCRKLFHLKMEGNTFPEIQRVLGVRSINTVYTWDARCRKKLLSLMGGRWESLSTQESIQRSKRETVS